MNQLKTLLSGLERNDVGLVLLMVGLALVSVPSALIVTGVLLILDAKKLRSWF